jgi:hypothetical protein
MVQHSLTHPVGGAGIATRAVEHQPDLRVPVSLQKRHDFPPGPMRQPAGDEQIGAPCPHRRVPNTAKRIGEPVGQWDKDENNQHDRQPKNAADASKTVSQTAFHVR